MKDRHGIGRAMERHVMDVTLRVMEWREPWQPPRGKFSSQDIWGLFDYIAISLAGTIVGVQVCRDRPSERDSRMAAIREWCENEEPALLPVVATYRFHHRPANIRIVVHLLGIDGVWRVLRIIDLPGEGYSFDEKDLTEAPK